MTLPNFLVIGAPKAGTTTLNYALGQHPQIYMSPVKEAGFFWADGQQIDFQAPGAINLRNRLVTDLASYQALFDGAAGQPAIGESSVRYLASPQSPGLIRQFIPAARLIASLRQPADRAFSEYSHQLRDGIEPCQSFAEAIQQEHRGERDHWMACRYLPLGFYARSLKRYLKLFDRSQIHISLLEDLQTDPQGLLRGLFRFLEVDQSFTPDLSHKHNVSGVIRNPVVRLIWTRSKNIRAGLRRFTPPQFRHAASEWVIQDLVKLPFPPDLRLELTEYYRQDILQLQDLIQRDLSGWLS
jgi:hypothetical protein